MEGKGADYTNADDLALVAFNFICDGMGAMNLSSLELVAAHLGIEDIGGLLDRLLTIKTHKAPTDDEPAPEG